MYIQKKINWRIRFKILFKIFRFFKSCFFLSTISAWNKLNSSLRISKHFSIFLKNIFQFKRAVPRYVYNCHNPKRIKLITQPHLGLRYLREYKLKHIFKTRLIFYAIVVAFAVMILNPQCNPCNESTISSTVPYCVCEQPKKICHCLCSSSSLFLSRRLFWTKY